MSHILLRLVSFDIRELTNIDDHPAATLYRREMTIPFFNPVLGKNELYTLRLKGYGVDLGRFGEAAGTCDGDGRC